MLIAKKEIKEDDGTYRITKKLHSFLIDLNP